MACSAAVLVEAEQRLHDHDQAGRGQISPNTLRQVCRPSVKMAPDQTRPITTRPTRIVLPVITTLWRRTRRATATAAIGLRLGRLPALARRRAARRAGEIAGQSLSVRGDEDRGRYRHGHADGE